MQASVGLIGVGLMGHGIAWNIADAGYRLTVLEHPGNQPLAELRAKGAAVAPSIADVAAVADVVILCVTGSPQVEAILTGDSGLIANLRPGMVVVDCSTALPESTERMAAAIEAAGGQFMDAAMTRLPQHARAGTLNLLVGGDPALLDRLRPLLARFSENITHVGGVGSGHRMKLLHNCVSLGFMALLSEVAAHGAKTGLDPATLVDVLARGGGGGTALDRLSPFLLRGDPSSMPFFIANAAKDLAYYGNTAASAGASRTIADAVRQTLDAVVADGHGQAFMPQLVELLVR